ncbi:MAG: efflux RND transporter periplasmic adaptor subunit [Cytophagia bacterium]|nr:efflux RND transporter periplasmic adaptor subunit [Cytophagia bacterium]NBW37061.1 efflux RND transporter periplasmic adaptor subunit [Cytophagia bacterium]
MNTKSIMKNILIITTLTLILAGCSKKEKEVVAESNGANNQLTLSADQLLEMQLQEVNSVPMAESFTAVGEVSFDEDNVVRIYPIVSGSVEEVHVSLGDYVKKGQLLATILSTDITVFQRDYNVAKADLEVADKNMSRAQDLYASGMMSEKDFAEAKKEYTNAKSEFNEKKQILELYGGSSERLDATFRVLAPRSGYIVERNVNAGTQIRTDNGTNIFTISDLKTVWIWANVHESDLAKVSEGDYVTVTTIAYPDQQFKGSITKIGTMLDPASRVIRVRTELNNENGLLKPEMFATVLITSKTSEKVLAIPQAAIVLENNQHYVMKAISDNTFEKVKVSVGRKFNEYAEINEGLTASDKVVVKGSLFALTAYNQKN